MVADSTSLKRTLSRRAFLKNTGLRAGAVFAFPTIIPARALGLNGTVSPSNRIVLGVLGMRQGYSNLLRFLDVDDVQAVAICDLDKRNIVRGIINIFGATPLAHTLAEGRASCDAASTNGIVRQTGSWQRSVPNFRNAGELVRNGRIGKISRIEVGTCGGYSKDEPPSRIAGEKIPAGLSERQVYRSEDHRRNFIDCVKDRRTTATPCEVAHRSASVGHLCHIAMRTGRTIHWDPATETIRDDAGATEMLTPKYRAPWKFSDIQTRCAG